MPDPLDSLVENIVERVKQRMAEAPPVAPVAAQSAPSPTQPSTAQPLPVSDEGARLAKMIDHTLLKPEATQEQLTKLCSEAKQYRTKTVCVNSVNVAFCAAQLRGSGVVPIAVVGFPLGAMSPQAKAFETKEAIAAGAAEIDMVINLGALKSQDYTTVYEDIKAVVVAAGDKPVKVILETGLLDEDQKIISCALSKTAGAAFVKTSTGFSKGGGATVEDIRLMRRIVGPEMGVKASGGVRTREDALAMIEAGANRLGASSSVEIITGQKGGGSDY